jgi:hypothetical protein
MYLKTAIAAAILAGGGYPGAPEDSAHTEQGVQFGHVVDIQRVYDVVFALMDDGTKELIGFEYEDGGEWCECPTGTREWFIPDRGRVCLSRTIMACSPLSPIDFMYAEWSPITEDMPGGVGCYTEDYGVPCGGLAYCNTLGESFCIDPGMSGVMAWEPCLAWEVSHLVFWPCGE